MELIRINEVVDSFGVSSRTLRYYEEMGLIEKDEKLTYEALSQISREALRLHEVRILRLPSMQVLTSRLKTGQIVWLDEDKMKNLFTDYGLFPSPGLRDCFFRKEKANEWLMEMKLPEGFVNESEYAEEAFPGGLYAVASSFMEDMDDTFVLLRDWIKTSDHFELDLDEEGKLQRSEMIEEILPWDIAKKLDRYQQDVFIPIRMNRIGDEPLWQSYPKSRSLQSK